MANTNFCARSGGSNLNAGTRTGNTTVPGTGADLTYASGNWVQATGIFTVASGNPASDGVAVGDFASVFADGSTVTGFVGRVTARDATTITVSGTAKSGTKPTDGTGNRTLKIGGAWKGPNGTEAFPFNFVENALTNSSGDVPYVNFKNDATYSITAGIVHGNLGPILWGDFTTSYQDGGKATLDGGSPGTSFTLLKFDGETFSGDNNTIADFIFANNGTSGSGNGLWFRCKMGTAFRCVAHDCYSNGFLSNYNIGCEFVSCEAYACGARANTGSGGFRTERASCVNCYSHDNVGGGNACGFFVATQIPTTWAFNVADSNDGVGFWLNLEGGTIVNCDAYNNGSDGFQTYLNAVLINCNAIKNGGYGVNFLVPTYTANGLMLNCGFGSGTQANTSGATTSTSGMIVSGTVTYASNVTPWNAPTTGDFTITLAAAKHTGFGTFTETDGTNTGTVGYPDIGAAPHAAPAASATATKLAGPGCRVA